MMVMALFFILLWNCCFSADLLSERVLFVLFFSRSDAGSLSGGEESPAAASLASLSAASFPGMPL